MSMRTCSFSYKKKMKIMLETILVYFCILVLYTRGSAFGLMIFFFVRLRLTLSELFCIEPSKLDTYKLFEHYTEVSQKNTKLAARKTKILILLL